MVEEEQPVKDGLEVEVNVCMVVVMIVLKKGCLSGAYFDGYDAVTTGRIFEACLEPGAAPVGTTRGRGRRKGESGADLLYFYRAVGAAVIAVQARKLGFTGEVGGVVGDAAVRIFDTIYI